MPTAIKVYIPSTAKKLADNDQWEHRMEIRSSSSNRLYIVAQNKKKRYFACSCPAWRTRRYCKHLTSMGLPTHEKPCEIAGKK